MLSSILSVALFCVISLRANAQCPNGIHLVDAPRGQRGHKYPRPASRRGRNFVPCAGYPATRPCWEEIRCRAGDPVPAGAKYPVCMKRSRCTGNGNSGWCFLKEECPPPPTTPAPPTTTEPTTSEPTTSEPTTSEPTVSPTTSAPSMPQPTASPVPCPDSTFFRYADTNVPGVKHDEAENGIWYKQCEGRNPYPRNCYERLPCTRGVTNPTRPQSLYPYCITESSCVGGTPGCIQNETCDTTEQCVQNSYTLDFAPPGVAGVRYVRSPNANMNIRRCDDDSFHCYNPHPCTPGVTPLQNPGTGTANSFFPECVLEEPCIGDGGMTGDRRTAIGVCGVILPCGSPSRLHRM